MSLYQICGFLGFAVLIVSLLALIVLRPLGVHETFSRHATSLGIRAIPSCAASRRANVGLCVRGCGVISNSLHTLPRIRRSSKNPPPVRRNFRRPDAAIYGNVSRGD